MSLGHLLREAIGDIYDLDSRLWRTLRPLVLRPGMLTVEFFAGRRARYLPPFRLYLVVSVALFLLAHQLSGLEAADIQFDDSSATHQAYVETQTALAPKRTEFERAGLEPTVGAERDKLAQRLDSLSKAMATAGAPDTGCDKLNFSFFGTDILLPRMRAACAKVLADKGAGLQREFLDNLPKLMFLLLPILALFSKILYVRSRRYYVEHLLFFVHVHVFVFLALCAIIVGNSLFSLVPGGVHPPTIVSVAVTVTMPAYLYIAMRRVYGQGRFKTFIKFGFLLLAYSISLLVTTIVGMLYSALTL